MTRKKGVKRSWSGKVKPTDAERHKRFVETAKEVEADERPEAFDRAFRKITAKPKNRE